jgi:hypothetical protein
MNKCFAALVPGERISWEQGLWFPGKIDRVGRNVAKIEGVNTTTRSSISGFGWDGSP